MEQKAVANEPTTSTAEEVYYDARTKAGLADVEAGRTISVAEAREHLRTTTDGR